MNDEIAIFHIHFESVKIMVNLVGLEGVLIGIVAEGKRSQIDVEEFVHHTD